MNNAEYIWEQLRPYRPAIALGALVERLNILYHQYEASEYDGVHPEIPERLSVYWKEMVDVGGRDHRKPWRVLDFGCGTGFEAEQVIQHATPEGISALTCYDSSPAMLERCRLRLAGLYPQAEFTTSLAALLDGGQKFDLLITNSLLHHLQDPLKTVTEVSGLAAGDALWFAGHEPSRRFFLNPECDALYRDFRRWRLRRRALSPSTYLNRFLPLLGFKLAPAQRAARDAFEEGLFQRKPPGWLVGNLVDSPVARDSTEAAAGGGFDPMRLTEEVAPGWRMLWHATYAYMGPHDEQSLPDEWKEACRGLASQYPADGANFCAVLNKGCLGGHD